MFLAAKPIFPGSVRCAFTVSNAFAFWNITLRSSRGYLKGVLHLELSTDILELELEFLESDMFEYESKNHY